MTSFSTHFAAGAGAGIVQLAVTAPLDTIKVHLQLGSGSFAAAATGGQRVGLLRMGAEIVKADGLGGLYYGFGAAAVQQMGKVGLQFALFQRCKRSIRDALGGTGAQFNWELAVRAQEFGRPIFLAGGLTAENVAEAVQTVQPFAVDVSSGVESAPGKKCAEKMRAFVAAAKGALD